MATEVNNRSLFKKKNQEARNALKKMGGIMGSSEELMNAVMGGAPSATVEKMTGQGMMNPVPFQPIIPSGKPMSPPQMRMQPQMGQPPQMMAQNQMRMQPQMGQRPQMGQPPQMNMPVRMAATGGIMDVYPSNYFIGGLLAKGVKQGVKQGEKGINALRGLFKDPLKKSSQKDGILNVDASGLFNRAKEKTPKMSLNLRPGRTRSEKLMDLARQYPKTTGVAGGVAGLGLLSSLFVGGEEPGVPNVPREQGPTAQEREAAKIRAMQGFAMAAGTSPFASRNIAQGMLYGLEAEERRQKEPDALFDQVYITRLQELLSQTDPETGQQLSFQEANQGAIDTASRIAPLARKAVDITEDRLNVPTIRTRSEYDELEPGQKYRDGTRGNTIRTKPLEEPEVETT